MKITIQRSGQQAAICYISHKSGMPEIAWIEVAPEFRGQHLASALLIKAQLRFQALVALPDPDRTGLNGAQITAWLLRHGFKHGWHDFAERGQMPNRKRALLWTR